MIVIRVDFRDEVRPALKAWPMERRQALGRALPKAALALDRRWKGQLSGPRGPTRLGVVSGALRSSVHVQREGELAYRVGTHLPYAAIHEHGGVTPPHEIRPRVGRLLSFYWPRLGRRIALPVVHHPGSRIPARPHLAPALQEAKEKDFPGIFRAAVSEAVAASVARGKAAPETGGPAGGGGA